MSVDKICTHNVATIAADSGIAEAAVRMRQAHVGDLIVTEYRDGRETPIGIVTDRDIVLEIIAEQVAPDSVKIGDIMSTDLVTVHADNGVEFAVAQMHKAGVRRVPVVGRHGELTGVLSLDDVLQHLANALAHAAEALSGAQRKETRLRP